jgi:hypothetical protein
LLGAVIHHMANSKKAGFPSPPSANLVLRGCACAVIVSQGPRKLYTHMALDMQEDFLKNEQIVKELRRSLTESRIARYLRDSKGDIINALRLYHWNSLLSQSLYLKMQIYEIALRNRINYFLVWKYGPSWPYNEKFIRQLLFEESSKLQRSKDYQKKRRSLDPVPTDPIVADLSIGFWSGLFARSYEVPFGWVTNLGRVFPNEADLPRRVVSAMCGDVADLRNRVAHHEPIYQLDLEARWNDLRRLTLALCGGAHAYAQAVCDFPTVFESRPKLNN